MSYLYEAQKLKKQLIDLNDGDYGYKVCKAGFDSMMKDFENYCRDYRCLSIGDRFDILQDLKTDVNFYKDCVNEERLSMTFNASQYPEMDHPSQIHGV